MNGNLKGGRVVRRVAQQMTRGMVGSFGVEALESRALMSGNVLVGGLNTVTEYGLDGVAVRRAAASQNLFSGVKDIAVDDQGRVAVFTGGAKAGLAVFDVGTGVWSVKAAIAGWSATTGTSGAFVSYGNLATYGQWVYATDNSSATEATQGIVVFDRANGYAATRVDTDVSPNDVAVGGDGKLYVSLPNTNGTGVSVQVFSLADGAAPSLERIVTLQGSEGYGSVSLAVDAAGTIYAAPAFGTTGGVIEKFDGNGIKLGSLSLGVTNVASDVAVSEDGVVAVAAGTRVYLTDAGLSGVSGNFFGGDSSTLTVAFGTLDDGLPNVAPTITNATPLEGAVITSGAALNAAVSFADADATDIHSVTIDWGDGSAPTVAKVQPGIRFASASHPYPALAAGETERTYTVTLDVFDGTDHVLVQRSIKVVPPTVELGPDRAGIEGQAVVFTPAMLPTSGYRHSWSVKSLSTSAIVASGASSTVNFTPGDNGVYEVTFTASSATMGNLSDTMLVTVSNAAPVGSVTASATSVNEGSSVTVTANVSDVAADVSAGFTYAWSLTRNGAAVAGSWSGKSAVLPITNDGVYVATVVVTDKDGGVSAPASVTINSAEVAPVVTFYNSGGTTEYGPVSGEISVYDPSPEDRAGGYSVTWAFEDAAGNVLASGAGTSVNVARPDSGNNTLRVWVTDGAGTRRESAFVVGIQPVAPTLTVTGAVSVNEGAVYTLNLASSDPGPDTISSWTIFWGDGTSSVVPGGSTSATHVYADGTKSYLISGTATDEDGTYSFGAAPVTWNGREGWTYYQTTADDISAAVVPQAGGKSVAVGLLGGSIVAVRINADGSMDTTYGSNGRSTVPVVLPGGQAATWINVLEAVTGSDGKTLVLFAANNGQTYVMRLNVNGGWDTTMGTGLVTTVASTIAAVPTGGFVTALGYDNQGYFAINKFTSTGAVDTTFGTNGQAIVRMSSEFTPGYIPAMTVGSDGKIVGVGTARRTATGATGQAVIRLNANGTTDNSFGVNGVTFVPAATAGFYEQARAVAVAPNGDIVFVGQYEFGAVDKTGAVLASTVAAAPGGAVEGLAVDADGRALIALLTSSPTGSAVSLQRRSVTGVVDGAFGQGGQLNAYVPGSVDLRGGMILKADGEVVMAGAFRTTQGTQWDMMMARFRTGLPVTVANVAPTVALSASATSISEQQSVALSAVVGDVAADLATVNVKWTVTKNGAAFATGTGANYTFVPNDQGTYVVSVVATDKDGASSGTASRTFTVSNAAPTAVFSSTGVIVEGASANVSFTGMSDAAADLAGLKYSYDWNNDGVYEVSNSSSPNAAVPSSVTGDGPGVKTIRARITDKDGASTVYTTTLTVNNAAPVAKISGPTSGKKNQKQNFTFSATDVSADVNAKLTYAIDWDGDGKVDQTTKTGSSLSASYSWNKPGTYTVKVWITDKDGGVGTATWTITIK